MLSHALPAVARDNIEMTVNEWRNQNAEPIGLRSNIAVQQDDGIVFLVYPRKGGLLVAALLRLMGRFARDDDLSRKRGRCSNAERAPVRGILG